MLSQAGPARKVSSSQANGAEAVTEGDSVFEGEVLYVSGAAPTLQPSDLTLQHGVSMQQWSRACTTPHFLSAGEESVEQIGSRAERMGLLSNSNIFLYSATRMDVSRCLHIVASTLCNATRLAHGGYLSYVSI